MIWFEQKIPREDAEVKIIGKWNPESSNMVEIIMFFNDEERTLYGHNPSGAIHGEPNPDDIHQKYRSKVMKYVQKAKEYSLTQLEGWKKY